MDNSKFAGPYRTLSTLIKHRRNHFITGVLFAGCVMLACTTDVPISEEKLVMERSDEPVEDSTSVPTVQGNTDVPAFALDPSWPAPIANDQSHGPDLTRNAMSIAVDPRDHVWILQTPTREERDDELAGTSQTSRIFEFDSAGNFVRGWGGPSTSSSWMEEPDSVLPYPSGTPAEHGMFIDHQNNIWVTGNGHVALKFSSHGELLLQIGTLGTTSGSNDTQLLGNSCELTIDPTTNEVYVADGYINRRVIVFDALSGDYKRHWGAYGNRPIDFRLLDNGLYADSIELHDPEGPVQQQFLAVHCVRVSKDGLVYVCDRQRNRVQVFQRDGTFVTEVSLAEGTPAELGFPAGIGSVNFGSASTVGFSVDAEQEFLYVGDNMNAKIWILRRRNLQLLGSIDTKAQANHYLSVDSAGNIYNSGLQKFMLQSIR